MKMWKGNENIATLLFSLKILEILHQERSGQVKTIVMEYFNSILDLLTSSIPVNQSIERAKVPFRPYLFLK